MVDVLICRDASGYIRSFQVRGHAGFEESGRDVVCSAISAIIQTAVMGLTDVVGIEPIYSQKNGLADCIIPWEIPEDKMQNVGVVMETMLIGLKSVEMGYGEYISIRERQVG